LPRPPPRREQYLEPGPLDELSVNIVPVLLRDGVRLFDLDRADPIALEQTRVLEAPSVTHVRYRVAR
jgi:dihydrofolate reductase